MSLQGVLRWFVPKEAHFFDYVEAQAVIAHEAAMALAEFRGDGVTAETTRQKVQEVEHRGDKLVHAMEEALAKTFVTPIDREDLQRLSSELDTIADLINAGARACAWFGVDRPTPPMGALMLKLVECTEVLRDSLPALRKHEYPRLVECGRALRTREKEADTVYREAVSRLFKTETDARIILREKEVLDDLENAVDHCETVGHLLVNLAVKHG
jgi:uncharacterized protein Yka (UPF0111/DUF47 family)